MRSTAGGLKPLRPEFLMFLSNVERRSKCLYVCVCLCVNACASVCVCVCVRVHARSAAATDL